MDESDHANTIKNPTNACTKTGWLAHVSKARIKMKQNPSLQTHRILFLIINNTQIYESSGGWLIHHHHFLHFVSNFDCLSCIELEKKMINARRRRGENEQTSF